MSLCSVHPQIGQLFTFSSPPFILSIHNYKYYLRVMYNRNCIGSIKSSEDLIRSLKKGHSSLFCMSLFYGITFTGCKFLSYKKSYCNILRTKSYHATSILLLLISADSKSDTLYPLKQASQTLRLQALLPLLLPH
jgi:hypothetical protein